VEKPNYVIVYGYKVGPPESSKQTASRSLTDGRATAFS